jgi:phosphoribosylanthranilate isomerase
MNQFIRLMLSNILAPRFLAIFLSIAFLTLADGPIFAQYEFTSFTVVESIVPGGAGRSRIISATEERNHEDYVSINGKDGRNKSSRKDIRMETFEEIKLLNFYSIAGLRFQNIAANDAVINSKVNAMMADEWELISINSGVESDAGEKDGNGIFITRFYFKRAK